MPFVEGGIVVDEETQQQASPQMAQGGFVQGGIEVDPTPEDSYDKVLQFQAAQTDYTPSKQEFLDYLKVSKTKPLLGEKPLETIGTAAVQTVEDIASMPYKLGEAIGQYMDPPEGVTPMQVAGGTAAEIAVQSRLKAENMGRGLIDTALNKLSDITGKLRNDDDKYEAFLAAAEIKRQLARANAPGDQRVPASQDVLQAYGIPEEAISQEGLDVGGFLADPSSIAFAGGGKLASALAQRAIPLIPRAGQILQRTGERISNLGRVPENMAGRFTAGVTGSEQMGQAVQEGIAKGTTGITLGEAAGLPITMNVPGLGTVAKTITATKGLGGAMETVGEAGTVSGGPSLTATQRGLLGAGERIAAAEGASSRARALGTALARSGLETPIRGAATILLPMAGAGVAGGALAALTGEEGDAVAAAIGSGAGFGVFDGGFTLAKAVQANAFNGGRVRQTAVDDLNTRPTDVQFTYIDPVAGEQTATIKDSEARATLYGRLNNKQLTKALSEVAGAEGAGVDVIFHTDADTVPAGLQNVNYAGVAIGPDNIKSGKPTILINVDKASPEALPHEILHARITQDMVSQLGAKAIDTASADPNFQRQFTDFANKYADKLQSAGGRVVADRIRTELRDAFDPAQQRAQKVESLKRITDEFAAYYTQEMLKGKDPKTMLPGRIPSFFEMALNNAKEAVSERFTRRALQAGFDPVARTFYDANGRRIKLDWMEDAIKNLVTPKEGYEPTEQRVDINKMTQAQQNAVIMARGYSDLFMTAPDGSIVRPLSKAEIAARTADIANRTIRVVESVPQAERTSISGMDAYGNPVIEGRLSLAEADAVSKSGIFGPSSSRTLIDIATAIRDGTLMEGSYWKVYGSTGRSGVFGESQKLFLPYGISINSKGGVNVKVVDWGKVQARMYKALTKPAYKSLFNNYDQAMSTMRDVYLKNIAETGAVPSAEALGGGIDGAKKRNMFNEIMGAVPKKGDVMVNFPTSGYVANRKGGSVYQDLRLERIQNADSTKAQIPWTGDMGEQSSYRRTQLNFMPAEAIGETRVSTDENGGYRILSKNGKFRLYSPDGSTVGIFDTQEQAKLKAEKDYATQTRLQPEVRQQQRQAGDEVGQATEAGGRNRAVGGQEGQGEGGAVRQAGDVVRTPDETVEPGTLAPDSGIDDIPLTGSPIKWDTAPEISQIRFMPEIDRNAFPTIDQGLFARLKEQTGTLAAIHIDRLRVGKYKDVDLQGGMFYPAIKDNLQKGVVWAFNSPGVARAVAKRAADNNGLVKLVLMQEGNVIGNKTFTHIWFNDLKENIQNGLVSKSAALRELNDVRSKFAKHKNDKLATGHSKSWKTLDEAFNNIVSMPQQKRASTYFQKSKTETKSEGEKIAYQSLLSKKMTGAGFPDAIKIVDAIEEPAFKGVPSGAAVGIIQIDPLSTESSILTGKEAGVPEHLSYEYVLKGKPVAKMEFYSVVEQIAPETKGKMMSQAQVNFPIEKSIPQAAEAAGQLRFMPASDDIRFMPDYSGEHKAPQRDYGAPLDNLKGVYPDDVYGPNAAQYYGHSSGDATDKAAARIIQATKGKPDAPVKVFRAIPKSIQSNEINPGDWITTIKSYAVDHGEGPLGGDYKILEKTVPAGDLYTNGDSIFEFGYDPKFMPETIQRDVGRNQDFANPPTDTEAVDALSSEKKAKFGAARSIKPGTQVAARIDIPAFLRTGKYVVAVHEPDGAAGGPGKVIGYDTVTRLQNPKFVVKPGVQRIYEGKSAKFPVATVDGKIMADRSIPADLENYVAVGMDPKEHAFFYDKRTDQPVIGGSEAVSVGNTVFVKNPVYGKPEDFRYMPQPDSAMPGAYSFPGGYRALPGKAKGSLRLYGPAGSLIGIASSLDEAQRILRRKNK